MISGSGIPQIEGVLLRKLDMNWLKVILGKFVAGVLSIGSELSLGRERPSVQLGASVGLGFGKIFSKMKLEQTYKNFSHWFYYLHYQQTLYPVDFLV